MKNLNFALIALLFLSFAVSGQQIEDYKEKIKTFDNKRNYFARYDKFKDRTILGFNRFYLGDNLQFGMTSYKREDLAVFYLVIRSRSKTWRFLRNSNLIILADKTRINLGRAEGPGKSIIQEQDIPACL